MISKSNSIYNGDFIYQNKKMLEFAELATKLFWCEEQESFVRKDIFNVQIHEPEIDEEDPDGLREL